MIIKVDETHLKRIKEIFKKARPNEKVEDIDKVFSYCKDMVLTFNIDPAILGVSDSDDEERLQDLCEWALTIFMLSFTTCLKEEKAQHLMMIFDIMIKSLFISEETLNNIMGGIDSFMKGELERQDEFDDIIPNIRNEEVKA